jgi:hypothetical protein
MKFLWSMLQVKCRSVRRYIVMAGTISCGFVEQIRKNVRLVDQRRIGGGVVSSLALDYRSRFLERLEAGA